MGKFKVGDKVVMNAYEDNSDVYGKIGMVTEDLGGSLGGYMVNVQGKPELQPVHSVDGSLCFFEAELAAPSETNTADLANAEIEKLAGRFGAETVFMAALVGLRECADADKAGRVMREKYDEMIDDVNDPARRAAVLDSVMYKAVEQIKE